MRAARRGSTMLMAVTKATLAVTRMKDTVERANKLQEEKRRRAEFAMIVSTTEKWIWVTDEKDGYVPAKVLKENPDGSIEGEFGVARTVKVFGKKELGPPIVRINEVRNHVDDMVRMGDVNEATILHNLRMRFLEDLIYTNIGAWARVCSGGRARVVLLHPPP